MNATEWKKLAPGAPAAAWENRPYVPRPGNTGANLVAELLLRGLGPLAIVGPPGVGKSSELEASRLALQSSRSVGPVLGDHAWPLHMKPSAREFLLSAGHLILKHREVMHRTISAQAHARWNLGEGGDFTVEPVRDTAAALDLLTEVARDIRNLDPDHPPALLIDGLERCEDAVVTETLTLLEHVVDLIDLAVVIPTRALLGAAGLRVPASFRTVPLQPMPVRDEHGPAWREGRAFLVDIVRKRLSLEGSLDEGFAAVLDRAAELSGGIPRVFLQLVQDAAFYGGLGERVWPGAVDLRQAMSDQVGTLRRLLQRGDLAALHAARGTDGLEVSRDRRLRFLSHGLLLEYGEGEDTRVFPAPLLEGLLALRSAA